MAHNLIVARMNPADAAAVAAIFAESDATELPHMIGVTQRKLFRFHELYFHLVESNNDLVEPLYRARGHELYRDINVKLARYMTPYHPSWREPKDSMAIEFYSWTPSAGSSSGPSLAAPVAASNGSSNGSAVGSANGSAANGSADASAGGSAVGPDGRG